MLIFRSALCLFVKSCPVLASESFQITIPLRKPPSEFSSQNPLIVSVTLRFPAQNNHPLSIQALNPDIFLHNLPDNLLLLVFPTLYMLCIFLPKRGLPMSAASVYFAFSHAVHISLHTRPIKKTSLPLARQMAGKSTGLYQYFRFVLDFLYKFFRTLQKFCNFFYRKAIFCPFKYQLPGIFLATFLATFLTAF